jgi:4-hydroxy-2-oxoheptanedioate aldolase
MNHQLKLAATDGVALGAWMFLREPVLAEAASKGGYDYVCIDLQHGLCGFEHVDAHLAAVCLGGAAPIVRVPWNESWMIGRALDAGALGVIVPMVNSAAEAARAVAACRYAPTGERSFGPIGAMARHQGHVRSANADVMCIVMIETVQAVEQVEEIVAVPGVDAVYVGPSDLSLTMGLPPASDQQDPAFHEALARIVAACDRHGVIPGIHATAALAAARREAGFRMITVGYDHAPVMAGLAADLQTARD